MIFCQITIFHSPFHNASVIVAQVRQLQAEKAERARQDEAKAVQAAREVELAKEREKMEAEIRRKYEAEYAAKRAADEQRHARRRRKVPRSRSASGTEFESSSSPLSNRPRK